MTLESIALAAVAFVVLLFVPSLLGLGWLALCGCEMKIWRWGFMIGRLNVCWWDLWKQRPCLQIALSCRDGHARRTNNRFWRWCRMSLRDSATERADQRELDRQRRETLNPDPLHAAMLNELSNPVELPGLEATLTGVFGERIKTDDKFCTELWSALANVEWIRLEDGEIESYSFRAAGGLIAEIRGSGSYMDWYCCGPYAVVSEEIWRTLRKAGWHYINTPDICDEPGCLADAGCVWPSEKGYRHTCGTHYRQEQVKRG